jgi:hypothetical protein
MSEGINQPNSTTDQNDFRDAGDRTEELTQAQQGGLGNQGGLDRKVEDANITGGTHSGGGLAGSAAGAIDGATDDLINADPTAPEKSGFSSTQGDGPNSQSGASAGSGGMGQRT